MGLDPEQVMRNFLLVSAALLAVWTLRRPPGEAGSAPTLPTEHFTLQELTGTATGLRNSPDRQQKANLALLAADVLEPMRTKFGPLRITSGYRSPAVNSAVGGSSSSSHMDGRAADLYSMSGNTAALMAAWLYRQPQLPLRQVIVENHTGHLHVEMQPKGEPFKRQFLSTDDGNTYQSWSPSNV